jgi:hypothetical protein
MPSPEAQGLPLNFTRSEELNNSETLRLIARGAETVPIRTDQLSDIDTSALADGHVLRWDAAERVWKTVPYAAPGTGLLKPTILRTVTLAEETSGTMDISPAVPTPNTTIIDVNGVGESEGDGYTISGSLISYAPGTIREGARVSIKYQ